jgi:hypothetical protein
VTRRVVSVIGPTSVQSTAAVLGISADAYKRQIRLVARTLARWRVTLAVNGDSETSFVLAHAFLRASDNPVRWYVQRATDPWASGPRSTAVVVSPKDIPASLVRIADVVLCIGFGTGTALEVCLAKFESSARVLVLSELVSDRLPRECGFNRLFYISATSLGPALSSALGPVQEPRTLVAASSGDRG